jgi:hypothetical protein
MMYKKKLKNQSNVFLPPDFQRPAHERGPLASELIAHQAFHLSPMARHAVLASDLAAFHDSLKSEGQWKRRSARND